MSWFFLLFSNVLVQIGLAIILITTATLSYIIVRRPHSRSAIFFLCAVFLVAIVAMIFFRIPNGFPRGLGYTFSESYGPAGSPGLPFENIIQFFLHFKQFEKVPDIARKPSDIPIPIDHTEPKTVKINVSAKEVISEIAPNVYQNFWTYDGNVPGPLMRVMEGDTVTVTFHNDKTSLHYHTIDFHSIIGPGGGASVLRARPGETKTLTFTALHPGLYVYHCAESNPAIHMTHGQYGMMLVEPKGGLPKVDKEFYIMQGEFYTTGTLGKKGLQIFDSSAMLDGHPQYIVFNGKVRSITADNMRVHTGEKVRIFFGNGGVNLISSFHIIGEIFDQVYEEASLTSAPFTNIQTTVVPVGGATMVEFTPLVPGDYTLVDHSLARTDRGAWGILHVDGAVNPNIFSGEIQPMLGH